MRLKQLFTTMAGAVLLTSCSDAIVSDCDIPGEGASEVSARFSDIQAKVFDVSCALPGCHAGSAPQANLNLGASTSYASLVGVSSLNYPAEQRVKAGSSAESVLISLLRRERSPAMPPSGPLPSAVIDSIARWIDQGAEHN